MRITIKNLNKTYDNGLQALDNINFVLGNGMFGLLGPNGSGKTTLIRILATLLKPTSGTVTFDDIDLQEDRAAVRLMTGYLPQKFSSFPRMKTWEFLDYTAILSGMLNKKSRVVAVEEMLERLGLAVVRNIFANELSVAMKRHLEIAQAVIGNPKVLIVDEPTSGLSTEERIRFKDMLAGQSIKIEIIILSTHIQSDITSAFNNVAILDNGGVDFLGAPDQLDEQMKDRHWPIAKPGS